MKRAMLVMVHGSPRAYANDDMYRVVDLVRERYVFDIVKVGFLECNEPLISDAIDQCVSEGAEQIIAVPYFLHTGTHVAEDLPDLLEQGRERHPNVEFLMGRYLGESARLTEILKDRIKATGN